MSNLQHRQSIIQEKRKKTPWRDFVMEICSWRPVMFYKNKGKISRYPDVRRVDMLISIEKFEEERDLLPGISFNGLNFFGSIQKLREIVPTPTLYHNYINENCSFSDVIYGSKNTYLSFAVGDETENIVYSNTINSKCLDIYNSFQVYQNCNSIYNCSYITNSSSVFFSWNIHNSSQIRFSSDCVGCFECINCSSLVNISYAIENKIYTKEEYFLLKKGLLGNKVMFENYYSQLTPKLNNIGCINVQGKGNMQCENLNEAYYVSYTKNGKNCLFIDGSEKSNNIFDTIAVGLHCNDFYAVNCGGMNCSNIYCSTNIGSCADIYYSDNLESCSFCLGCIGLKNKSYCILNKQYTKEERYTKVDEIFGSMHADGTLGDFFPATMNPFYFNDTAAYLIGSSPAGTTTKGGGQTFTKEEVTAKGYLRRDEPIKVDIPAGVQTVSVKDLDKYEGWKPRSVIARNGAERNDEAISNTDYASLAMTQGNQIASSPSQGSKAPRNDVDSGGQQWYIDDEILKKVIIDEQGNAYRIIPMELEFLRKYELPLPRKHWLDRMKENFRIS